MHTKTIVFSILLSSLLFASFAKADLGDGSGVDSYLTDIPTSTPPPIEQYYGLSIQSINPDGSPIMFPAYNSTTVTLTYATSINYTLTVSSPNIDHYETSSPSGITFIANGVSTYMLHYQVLYDVPVNQSIVLTVRSGNGQTISLPLASYNSGFTLDVIITTMLEPKFPSAADLWDYGNAQQAATLLKMSSDFKAQQDTANVILGSLVAFAIVISVLIVVFWRHLLRERVRLTRIEKYGYGYKEDE